jgi:hypothetical protein
VKVRLQLGRKATTGIDTGRLPPTQAQTTQLQTAGKHNVWSLSRRLYQKEGIRGFYHGLSASLLRQLVFSGTRHGLFGVLIATHQGADIPSLQRVGYGLIAGSMGAIMATPADVTLVRMQADNMLPSPLKRRYQNVFHGIYTIMTTEGFTGAWRGCIPTLVRATIVTGVQLPSYDIGKRFLCSESVGMNPEHVSTHTTTALFAAAVTASASAPIDLIKTQMMQTKSGQQNKNNTIRSSIVHIYASSGVVGFWRGLTPNFLRLAPHNIILWITMEQISTALRNQHDDK